MIFKHQDLMLVCHYKSFSSLHTKLLQHQRPLLVSMPRGTEETRIWWPYREVVHASLTPLVFSTTGGMIRETMVFYHHLADHLQHHASTSYIQTLAFILWMLLFFYYNQLQCASVDTGPFCIALLMPPLRWAASTWTIRAIICIYSVVQHIPSILRAVGKGSLKKKLDKHILGAYKAS